MMTAEQLKNSILQLAMQGKLVEQRPEEGTGENLYKEIQVEKKRLIKKGRIKKQKALPDISDKEVPFDIPETWKWVRLGEVAELTMGQSPKGDTVFEGGSGVEFHQGKIYFSEYYLLPSTQTTTAPTKIVEPNTVLLCVRAPVGTVNITPRMICIGRGLCGVKTLGGMEPFFMLNWLRAIKDILVKKATGTTFIAITGKVVEEELIPLPPLAEQKRIVAKIEELMPFVEQYAAASTKLNTLNASFPEMMKKSILQEAVQGKLVPQDPNDEPASVLLEKIAKEKKRLIKEGKIKRQKSLPDIMDDEIPFDIPESWEWVRLSDISKQITDGEHSTPKRVSDFCGFYLLSARNVRDGEIKLDDVDYVDNFEFERISSRCNPVKGDILISCSGSVGRCAVVNDDNKYVMVRSAAMVSLIMCDSNYLMYTIQSDCVQRQINALKKQTAQANLFLGAIAILKIPLPPYNEQKRIVTRLNQVLNYTEKTFNTLSLQ